jgi:hypothetical protein
MLIVATGSANRCELASATSRHILAFVGGRAPQEDAHCEDTVPEVAR